MTMAPAPDRPIGPRDALDAIGLLPDAEIDIAEAALQFARIDLPDADATAARATLSAIARDAAALGRVVQPDDLPARSAALARLLVDQCGFRGDTDHYDDPANANLIRVIERRRGLPVALGVVWLHAAQAAGWPAHGVDFPAHFLLALEGAGAQLVVDMFDGGTTLDARALRALLKRIAGPEAELQPGLLRPAGHRAVLLRLQNNLRTRRLSGGDLTGALAATRDMLRIAPDDAGLWRAAGVLHQRLDQVGAALQCFERFLSLAPVGEAATRLRREMETLRARLN
jgi:regulator of sirC expression with transglutaminase-like and TPR domain